MLSFWTTPIKHSIWSLSSWQDPGIVGLGAGLESFTPKQAEVRAHLGGW